MAAGDLTGYNHFLLQTGDTTKEQYAHVHLVKAFE